MDRIRKQPRRYQAWTDLLHRTESIRDVIGLAHLAVGWIAPPPFEVEGVMNFISGAAYHDEAGLRHIVF